MDAAAITSTAPAVHQELIRALAERVRIHRHRDQQQRLRERAQFGAGRGLSARHDGPSANADLSVVSWLPHALPRSFGPADRDSPAGFARLGDLVTLRTPARPTRPGTVG
jgi:hypothetical protein